MSTVDEFTDEFTEANETSPSPQSAARRILIITCMDARILPTPTAAFGLPVGSAFTVRNAGVERDSEALRSVVIAQQRLTTREIRVLHHTDCGLETFDDNVLRTQLIRNPPKPGVVIRSTVQSMSFLPFKDQRQTVRDDVAFLREHPLVLAGTVITGWIYNVQSGRIERVLD
ncbi:hypothetical protein BS47DRAFT_1354749 [Hydnum rufescens UP504]|uniref:Carbonic anhydrase n=1 Tax=Hydnum rufescens UP504 TaxID=1448309 RepID=A0A9P6AGG5_9AGAM|nr:hypothetical protein BS47DRAFT_1354749 [Hydnum rufescens UP504]